MRDMTPEEKAILTEIFPLIDEIRDRDDLDLLRETASKVHKELGPVSVAVHNAAQGAFDTILDADPVRFEELFRINTTALMVLTQCVAPLGFS